ncbi:MAG: hypothetical protein HYU66_28140, partial [Armatimonadetes bacterium]|nr:hypothetical protein [Armatimonadota bacterium]
CLFWFFAWAGGSLLHLELSNSSTLLAIAGALFLVLALSEKCGWLGLDKLRVTVGERGIRCWPGLAGWLPWDQVYRVEAHPGSFVLRHRHGSIEWRSDVAGARAVAERIAARTGRPVEEEPPAALSNVAAILGIAPGGKLQATAPFEHYLSLILATLLLSPILLVVLPLALIPLAWPFLLPAFAMARLLVNGWRREMTGIELDESGIVVKLLGGQRRIVWHDVHELRTAPSRVILVTSNGEFILQPKPEWYTLAAAIRRVLDARDEARALPRMNYISDAAISIAGADTRDRAEVGISLAPPTAGGGQ